ncbi:hypothetical protein CEXT_142811 [Caerostris extrusa]|uniref:Uncharacterized protein n=1 Tax=Caerostris extrusa TaxID=172846 RepID=A0AAV4UJQ0_CAEEX|nr:hypothetical protein CEXT_142811 [Caerostris extrusa]
MSRPASMGSVYQSPGFSRQVPVTKDIRGPAALREIGGRTSYVVWARINETICLAAVVKSLCAFEGVATPSVFLLRPASNKEIPMEGIWN